MPIPNATSPNQDNNGPDLRLVPPAAAAAIVPAGFWRRFVAAFLDGILLLGVERLLFWAIGISSVIDQPIMHDQPVAGGFNFGLIAMTPEQLRAHSIAFAVGAVMTVGYCFGFYRWKAATLGKLALGLKVVDMETGERLGFGQTILREFFGKWCSSVIFFGGYLMAAFRRDKRALHDFIAGSQVRRR
jgi:uncharacterized RDD family membrane protein YckC